MSRTLHSAKTKKWRYMIFGAYKNIHNNCFKEYLFQFTYQIDGKLGIRTETYNKINLPLQHLHPHSKEILTASISFELQSPLLLGLDLYIPTVSRDSTGGN